MFYSNRGMYLETLINYTIEKYNSQQKTLIFKNSLPLVIKDNKFRFLTQGTVDYHGTFLGKYLCFEAKMTKLKYLPWNNIKEHQWNFLVTAFHLKALSFIIIYFDMYDEYYLVFTKDLIPLKIINEKITYQWVNKNGHKIKFIYPFLLDFIEIIEQIL